MPMLPLFDETFLRAQWDVEFRAFSESPEAAALLSRLRAWAARERLNERASETAFIQRFFVETWGYTLQGHAQTGSPYTCRPQFEVAGAGQSGGTGYADLALGHFGAGGTGVAQVLGEFKDIRSGLDARQFRKQNDRSPVDRRPSRRPSTASITTTANSSSAPSSKPIPRFPAHAAASSA